MNNLTIDKKDVMKLSDKMFDLAFDGLSTDDLSRASGITKGQAILLQSGSTKASDEAYLKMVSIVNRLV